MIMQYEDVIEQWVRMFYSTMAVDGSEPEVGDDSGDTPFGVKIIFDGYGETDDGDVDYNTVSFAVFVHQHSLTKEFPPHDLTPWALIHRPKEEVCIYVWYNVEEDQMDIIPFEDSDTELDHNVVYQLISDIWDRDEAEMD